MERYDSLTRKELTDLLSEARKLVDSRDGGVDETHRLLHDLQLHRLELELQNRDLRDSRQALEESRDRYLSLFDFAPVAYFIVDAHGLIRDINLTSARMFGRERSAMVNRPFAELFTEGSTADSRAYLRRVFDAEGPVTEDFRLRAGDGGEGREVRLDGVVFGDGDDGRTCLLSMLDVSERRRLERKIKEKHVELTSIVRAAPIGIGLVRERVFTWLSPRFLDMLGYTGEELLNRSSRVVYPDDEEFERVGRVKYDQVRAEGIGEVETRMRHKDGSELKVLLRSVPLDPGDLAAGVMFTAWDITDRKRAEDQRRLDQRVLNSISEGVLVTDAESRIVAVNPAFTATTGYAPEQVMGRNPNLLASGRHDQSFYAALWADLNARGTWQGEIWNRRSNGDLYLEWLTINTIGDEAGNVSHYVGVFADITSQARTRERLFHLAYHDQLTDLPNRELFYENFSTLLHQARRHETEMALLFIDLDRFKQVNDAHGHLAGDAVLKAGTGRLLDAVRQSDVVSRLGGDEFLVLLPEISGTAAAEEVARKIALAFDAPFKIGDVDVNCSASVGISIYPTDGQDVETLIRKADDAMYRHKLAARGGDDQNPVP